MKTGRFLQLCCILCVLLTQFGFAQWTHINAPAQNVMYLAADGTVIVAQTDAGFFYSADNGLQWTQVNSGFSNSLAGAFFADSVNFLMNNVFMNAISYLPAYLPANLVDSLKLNELQIEYASLLALATSVAILYPGTNIDSIYISLDTGSTALRISQIMSSLALYAAGVDTGNILSEIDVAQMQLSIDGGKDWISLQQVMSSISVRAAVKNDYYFYAGTNRGVFRAAVNGNGMPNGWSQVNSGLADTNVHALANIGDAIVFAGTDHGVFASTTNGAEWNAANTGLTNSNVLAFAVVPANGTNLFAGTYGGGVFVSIDYGNHWDALNTGLTNLYVTSLAVSGPYLYAGTYGGGLWKLSLSYTTSVPSNGSNDLPSKFSLSQNYPNPFNPSTIISYQLAKNSRVSLKVFDLLGREVTTLVNGVRPAGTYTATFNAVNLPSGVYFYRLTANATQMESGQAGTFTETRRLLLLK